MTSAVWTSVVLAVACTAAGVATGWWVASRAAPLAGAAPPPAHPHEHEHGPALNLSPTTLRNLGVTFAAAKRSELVVTVPVAAVVADAPATVQPVAAPIGGQVTALLAAPGTVAAAGAGLVRLVREPLPRPVLDLTGPLLSPASESLHDAVHELRRAHREVDLVAEELARVEKFTAADGAAELPVLPRQRAIDLRQQLARARAEYERRVAELDKHGLADEQITAIAGGAPLPAFDEATWRQALAHNGLWTEAAQAVHGALAPAVRRVPWVIATIGELAASGLVSAELASWLREHADAGSHFPAIGALLQRGHSLADIDRLHRLGALAPAVVVAAPAIESDWDVHELRVKPGEQVAAGQVVAVLRNPRRMQLQATPLPGEVGAVARAVAEGLVCRATPLVPDTGPVLAEVRLDRLLGGEDGRGAVALATVTNEPLVAAAPLRSWQLRAGTHYQLRVPTRTLREVFVLPAAALARDGARQVVLIRDEHGIEAVEVAVVHADDEVVAVEPAEGSPLAEGVEVAQSGAFELSLALKGAGDDGAAHHHH